MSDLQSEISEIIKKNLEALGDTYSADGVNENLLQISEAIINSLKAGGKVLLCGNGGSAADAQHIAGEFIGRFKLERKSFPAIALTTDTSVLTCVANDYSFNAIFSRQVEGLGKEGDILFAISTSGNSENVIEAIKKAKEMKIKTVSFTGGSGGSIKGMTDFNFNVLTDYTPYVQSGHIIAYHTVCQIVEQELAKDSQ